MWIGWLISGALMILGGLVALLNPFAATLTVVVLAGWGFVIGGLVQLFAVYRSRNWTAWIWTLVLALACLWLGVALILNPLAGMVTLTVTVALVFLLVGLVKIVVAFALRPRPMWWTALLSGGISAALGLFVLVDFAAAATAFLGILLAVELVSTGATLISLGLFLRNHPMDGPGK